MAIVHVEEHVMSSKLTLNMDEAVVERAKRYARSRGMSLSKVIQQYLQFITESETEATPTEVTDRVARLADTLETAASDDELKFQYLSEKYLDAQTSR
jgi:macrodomain Ter protein organizer (MatP/YcbG family)